MTVFNLESFQKTIPDNDSLIFGLYLRFLYYLFVTFVTFRPVKRHGYRRNLGLIHWDGICLCYPCTVDESEIHCITVIILSPGNPATFRSYALGMSVYESYFIASKLTD